MKTREPPALIRLLHYGPIATCLVEHLADIDKREDENQSRISFAPFHEERHVYNPKVASGMRAVLSRLSGLCKRLAFVRSSPDPPEMSIHQLYTLTVGKAPRADGKRPSASRKAKMSAMWSLALTCRAAHTALSPGLYRVWRVRTSSRGETLAVGMLQHARENIRMLTVEGGPRGNTDAPWFGSFLRFLTGLRDLHIILRDHSRRLVLSAEDIPVSIRHLYWRTPSAEQIHTLLACHSITSLSLCFDPQMPEVDIARQAANIRDLGILGPRRPPPVITHRPLWFPNARRYYFSPHTTYLHDIVSAELSSQGEWHAALEQELWFRAACRLPGQVLFFIGDPDKTTGRSRALLEGIQRLKWKGMPEKILASKIVWLWFDGDGLVVVKFGIDHDTKRYRKAHRTYECAERRKEEEEWWHEVNKVEDAWSQLGVTERRAPRRADTTGY